MLKTFPDNYFHAIITDPPAGISFMQAAWDGDKGGRDAWIAWLTEIAAECLRVIRPGGHAFVWALPRTSHWTGMAWENAGWEPRDKICHVFGQGFPKSMDISKALDRDNKAEREIIGKDQYANRGAGINGSTFKYDKSTANERGIITAPASPEAIQWAGYGTALKPSHEDWWLFRKPLAGRVIDNIRAWGCGGINVDGCRIATDEVSQKDKVRNPYSDFGTFKENGGGARSSGNGANSPMGRFPANLILSHSPGCVKVGRKKIKGDGHWAGVPKVSKNGIYGSDLGNKLADASGHEEIDDYLCSEDCAIRLMGEQSGICKTGVTYKNASGTNKIYGKVNPRSSSDQALNGGDSGTAARFFLNIEPEPFIYCSKASPSERAGCKHPTIKPLKLIKYLVTLICPPGGMVLDPFLGSGTTGIACNELGFDWVGIDLDTHFAEERLATPHKPLTSF